MTPRWSVSRRRVRPEDRLLPLLRRYPEVWGVLIRHGIGSRGGPGPSESVATFAMSRQLDPAQFRDECSAIVRTRSSSQGTIEAVYRAYLVGGVALTILTVAIWAVWLLSRWGVAGGLGSTELASLQAHAESQVYGGIDFLCMGLSYAILPRIWRGRLAVPWVSGLILALMLMSLLARALVLAPALVGSVPLLENLAAWLQLAAVLLFGVQFALTFRRSRTRAEPITGFLMVGLGWLLASSALSALAASVSTVALGAEVTPPSWLSPPFREPLRAMRNHGLALAVSLGLGLSLLPRYFNLPAAGERRAWWSLDLITTAAMAEILLAIALRASGNEIFVVGLVVSRLMLAAGVGLMLWAWRPWRPIPGAGACGWFVRGAFAWLVLSMALLVLQPALDLLAGQPPGASHEASRHALTLGHLTLLMVALATRAVAVKYGRDRARLPGLSWTFWLFCAAAGFRLLSPLAGEGVMSRSLTLGASALAGLAAMGCWGLILWRLWRGAAAANDTIFP